MTYRMVTQVLFALPIYVIIYDSLDLYVRINLYNQNIYILNAIFHIYIHVLNIHYILIITILFTIIIL